MAFATAIPATRVLALRLHAEHLQSMGAPVDQLLRKAGIPEDNLNIPDAVVPLKNAYQFLESACHSLHSEHPGLNVGLASSPGDFGSYGQALEAAPTVAKYLEAGIALYSTLTSGERLWLSEHGAAVRINIASPWGTGLGMHQSHLCTIAVTLEFCNKTPGASWSPCEIGLAYQSREKLPDVSLFDGARVITGLPYSYVAIPRSALGLRLPNPGAPENGQDRELKPLPDTFLDLLSMHMDALVNDSGNLHIQVVADSLGMTKRTLQRVMAHEGLNYSRLLGDIRMRRAMEWLDHSDKPVTDIALALGYTDASNFARAFRRHTGLSPRAFRDAAPQRCA